MEPARAQQCLAKAGDFGIVSNRQLTPEQAAKITAFTDPVTLIEVYETLDWTHDEEVGILLEIARNSEAKGTERLNAIKLLREILYVALGSSGMKAHVTKTVPGDGGSVMTFSTDLVAGALGTRPQQKPLREEHNYDNSSKSSGTGDGIGADRPRTSDTPADGGDGRGVAVEGTTGIPASDTGVEGSANAGNKTLEPTGTAETVATTGTIATAGHKPPVRESIRLFPGIAAS